MVSGRSIDFIIHTLLHHTPHHQVRFLDAILSQNNTDDHMQEFIRQGGLEPMLKLVAITPLVAEASYATANMAIVDTCRNILVCTVMQL